MDELRELLKKLDIQKHELQKARDKASFDLKVVESQIKKITRLLEDFNVSRD